MFNLSVAVRAYRGAATTESLLGLF